MTPMIKLTITMVEDIEDTNGSSTSLSMVTSPSKKRSSRVYGLNTPSDVKLSSSFYSNLERHLNLIAMKKKGLRLDEHTRRSFLRFYSELLDPKVKGDLKANKTPDYLLMKFVASSNREIIKLGSIPQSEISNVVFKQANEFVSILIGLVEKEKNRDLIVSKLNEHRDSLNPQKPKSSSSSVSLTSANVRYNKPSFKITDLDQATVTLLQDLFKFDSVKIQQDIFRVKDIVQEKALHQDIKQVLFYLEKDLGQFPPSSFVNNEVYSVWKSKEKANCESLIAKYPVPASMKLMSIPKLPLGEDFYILPRSSLARKFFVVLVKLCLELQSKERQLSEEAPLFSKQSSQLMNLCAKIWRIDYSTKAVCLFSAAHLSGMLKDSFYITKDPKDLAPVDVGHSIQILNYCKLILEDGPEKNHWPLKDQDEWVKNLTYSYNATMFSIKDYLSILFSKVTKPKFGPVLAFLGEYIESDFFFKQVLELQLPKKWEKKLSKTLLRVAETRYAELLENLPRDDTLSTIHVLDISESIVSDIQSLQKRYKNPLLGFLHVPRTVATVMTSMFAVDSKNILKHIDAYNRERGGFVSYGDSLEAYKSLCQIRDIYNQVNTTGVSFKFNLEKLFFSSLNEWVNESGEKIQSIVDQAIKNDNFKPVNIENDEKKFSTSVLDIFSLIREFLKILESLGWSNEYQLAKVYTILLKSISDGVLKYTSAMSDKIMFELNEDKQKKLLETTQSKADKRKSAGWFDEMKNVVNNIQIAGAKIEAEEPYNFRPETCVALNNLAAMSQQLAQLEDILDPELISKTVRSFEPNRQNYFTSHVFSLRLKRAENLASGGSYSSNIRPYVTLTDTVARKTIGKTRTINHTPNPEWDEEFELTMQPNTSITLSVTVWDEKLGTHSVCGRAVLQLDPKRFKHDGIPQEIFLDFDSQGRLLIEVAVESERADAIFVMGRAHRTLMRARERAIKLIVEKFSRFIRLCFSRANLKSICGNNGQIKPTEDQMHDAMIPLYDYLNSNLQVLAEFLTKDLLLLVMVAAWQVVVACADELLLPKLVTAKVFNLSNFGPRAASHNQPKPSTGGWQSAVTSAVANVTSTIGISGFGKLLTSNELETVFAWLNFLCFDFFHNDGNGPPIRDLKNEHYQSLLLLPVYYDGDIDYLKQEVERLSPAFVKSLRDRNNFDSGKIPLNNSTLELNSSQPGATEQKGRPRSLSRAGTMARNKTIMANATSKARKRAQQEELEARADPIAAQTSAEDIILRLLIIRDEKSFVSRRLEQREKLAHSIATERLARAAAEGSFGRR
ncbi:hypothetical protein PSN45_005316 [Yamadazyma tenuis]|uniref:uncharacterized protein n=1 Tax=Candida tenuis TaxID=2315449 RepID=UPI0027A8174B|nr:hypothetical protein PSN45_005316 [Yamadazyma tenuis]